MGLMPNVDRVAQDQPAHSRSSGMTLSAHENPKTLHYFIALRVTSDQTTPMCRATKVIYVNFVVLFIILPKNNFLFFKLQTLK